MAEYWKQVQAEIERMTVEKKSAEEVEKEELRRKQEEEDRFKEEREKRKHKYEESVKMIKKVEGIVVPILEDIRIQNPEIRKYPKSEVYIKDIYDGGLGNSVREDIELRWGIKYELSSEEEKIIKEAEDQGFHLRFFPKTIFAESYDSIGIGIEIDYNFLGTVAGKPFPEFFNDPKCIIPNLAHQLTNPLHHYKMLYRYPNGKYYSGDPNAHPVFEDHFPGL